MQFAKEYKLKGKDRIQIGSFKALVNGKGYTTSLFFIQLNLSFESLVVYTRCLTNPELIFLGIRT